MVNTNPQQRQSEQDASAYSHSIGLSSGVHSKLSESLLGLESATTMQPAWREAAIGPAGMQGYYIQGNYHFMPEFLKRWAPSHFTDASTFTAVVRWEQVDTDTDDRTRVAGNAGGNRRELERLTLGSQLPTDSGYGVQVRLAIQFPKECPGPRA